MATNPRLVLLVSCRHCLRPVALAAGKTDLELAKLHEHLRECVRGEPSRRTRDSDNILDQFRMVGDRG